jgi:hypothetical protein
MSIPIKKKRNRCHNETDARKDRKGIVNPQVVVHGYTNDGHDAGRHVAAKTVNVSAEAAYIW